MAGRGAPIRNDRYYPELARQAVDDHTAPLQLLARGLSFVDPLTGVERQFRSLMELNG